VKHSTTPNGIPDDQEVPTAFEKPDVGRMITSLVLIETIALIAICLTVGKIVAQLLTDRCSESRQQTVHRRRSAVQKQCQP
ncbi:sodium/glutamate symporter, partial [Escherichia sp. HC-CC]